MPGVSRSPPTNGAANTRTFFTHCRGRMVLSTPRATPSGVRTGATGAAGTSMSVIARTFRRRRRGAPRRRPRRPAGRPQRRRSGSARPGPAGTAPSAERAPGRACGPSRPPNSTAAAVVEVACADGKLSRLGVPTSTRTRGSAGRGRRTTRLTAIDAPCAAATPAVGGEPVAATAPVDERTEQAEREPAARRARRTCDMPRAVATTGGRADPAAAPRAVPRTSAGRDRQLDGLGRRRGAAGAGAGGVVTATGGISRSRWGRAGGLPAAPCYAASPDPRPGVGPPL